MFMLIFCCKCMYLKKKKSISCETNVKRKEAVEKHMSDFPVIQTVNAG